MSDVSDIAGQQDAVLAELLQIGMTAAREVQARLLAADDAKEACDLSLALGRISRSVRQTVALQAKLGRDRKRLAREDVTEAKKAVAARASRRESQVRAAVERAIWTEAEGDEADSLVLDLEELVNEEALYDGFADEPLAAQIERICTRLGLQVPPPLREEGDAAQTASARDAQTPGSGAPSQSLADSPAWGRSPLADHPWSSSA